MLDSRVIKGIATTRAPDFLNASKVGRIKADSYEPEEMLGEHLADIDIVRANRH